MHRIEKNITIWAEPYNHKTWHDRRVKYVTSKINLKTLFTMPMAPPPNKLSLHAKQFDGKTKERQCCARFYGGYCGLWPNRTARSLSRAWPSLLRAHNHIGGATAVPLHHKKCLLCSVLIYIVLVHSPALHCYCDQWAPRKLRHSVKFLVRVAFENTVGVVQNSADITAK